MLADVQRLLGSQPSSRSRKQAPTRAARLDPLAGGEPEPPVIRRAGRAISRRTILTVIRTGEQGAW